MELLTAKPKLAGMAGAGWQKRTNTSVGLARYMNGKLYYNESKYADTDKKPRRALPLADPTLKPEILFLLGHSNYMLKKPRDTLTFSRQCAAIKSPYQAQAQKNVLTITKQYRGLK